MSSLLVAIFATADQPTPLGSLPCRKKRSSARLAKLWIATAEDHTSMRYTPSRYRPSGLSGVPDIAVTGTRPGTGETGVGLENRGLNIGGKRGVNRVFMYFEPVQRNEAAAV